MSSTIARLSALTVLALAALAADARAQGPAQAPACHCGAATYPHYHPAARGSAAGGMNRSTPGGIAPGAAGPVTGLPRGRRYYGGRFFGSFNNRYYSPQYGYF